MVSVTQGKWTQANDWMFVEKVSAKIHQAPRADAEMDRLNMATTSQVVFDMPRWVQSLRIDMKKPIFWPTEFEQQKLWVGI